MLLKQLLLVFIGLSAGGVIAAGVFAFLAIIGIFPRLIGKTETKDSILLYETMIVVGGAAGNILDIFGISFSPGFFSSGAVPEMAWVSVILLAVVGLSVGVFVGSLIMSLAETAKALPVMNRRIHLAVGFQYVVLGIAVGKLLGALVYFCRGMGA